MDLELVLAYKHPQGYSDTSATLEEYTARIRDEERNKIETELFALICQEYPINPQNMKRLFDQYFHGTEKLNHEMHQER